MPEAQSIVPFDLVDFVIEFEGGTASTAHTLAGLQHLIDTGQAWSLQGFYGRTCASLIEQGVLYQRDGFAASPCTACEDKATRICGRDDEDNLVLTCGCHLSAEEYLAPHGIDLG